MSNVVLKSKIDDLVKVIYTNLDLVQIRSSYSKMNFVNLRGFLPVFGLRPDVFLARYLVLA